MKESKAVNVRKRDFNAELNREYQFYATKIVRDVEYLHGPARYDQKTQEVGCQYDSKRDNVICTCRHLAPLRRRQEVRYFGSPREIYAYQRSRSFTDIGVGSVKALQRKKVRRIYLPETIERGVGSSDLSAYILQRNKQHRVSCYYENKRTSSKCVGGILEYNIGCVINEKLSPIIHTVSGSTSYKETTFNKTIEIGSSSVVKSLTNTTTQVENPSKKDTEIKSEVKGRQSRKEIIQPIIVIREEPREMKKKTVASRKGKGTKEKPKEKGSSSDSLLQHVYNLENPSAERNSRTSLEAEDLMENKLEIDYRNIFTANSKSKDSKQSSNTSDLKSTSTLRRRFEALRRGLGKKDDSRKNAVIVNKVSSQVSARSRKDVSINSDPPSLEGRSFSNMKPYSSFATRYSRDRSSHYRRSVVGKKKERDSSDWSTKVVDEDSESQGVKGMFKLWGKKFNLEEDHYNRRCTPKPSYISSRKAPTKKSAVPKEQVNPNSKPEIEEKKEGRKFFFFKNKKKTKEKPFKAKKGVTAGRCEVRDGLVINILGGNVFDAEDIEKEPEIKFDSYEEIVRKAWLKKFLTPSIESRNSVKVRWNNKTYAPSSSTVFELMDNIYKDTSMVLRSRSEVTVHSSYKSHTRQHVNFMQQNIEAWMIPKTITDKPNLQLPVKQLKQQLVCKSDEDRKDNMEVTISDQKWFIDKSKAFSHKIEVVLHSKNFRKLHKEESSEYLRIDIPKGFFLDSSNDEINKQTAHQSSDEEVFKIVEYETGSDLKKDKAIPKLNIGDHKHNKIKVTVSVKESKKCVENVLETAIKKPTLRDVVIQGSNVLIPKRCDVVGVGIITHRELHQVRKPILKIQDDFSDEESEHNLLSKPNTKKCEFAESYLQEYYRHWTPLGIDLYSWCFSDSQLKCSSEHSRSSYHNQGDGTKSCPNIFEDFQTSAIVSSCGASSCSQCYKLKENASDKKKKNKKKDKRQCESDGRVEPKDSIEVFKRRKIYASSMKSKWYCASSDFDQPPAVRSCESGLKMDQTTTLTECPKVIKPCCRSVDPNKQRKRNCKKHVSLPDCDTMNNMLAKQLNRNVEGILAVKGSGCDVCKKKGTNICPKHATVYPRPICEIPRAPCRDSCDQMKKPPCSASKQSCDRPLPPCQSPVPMSLPACPSTLQPCKKPSLCAPKPPSCLKSPPSCEPKPMPCPSPPPCRSPPPCQTPPPCPSPPPCPPSPPCPPKKKPPCPPSPPCPPKKTSPCPPSPPCPPKKTSPCPPSPPCPPKKKPPCSPSPPCPPKKKPPCPPSPPCPPKIKSPCPPSPPCPPKQRSPRLPSPPCPPKKKPPCPPSPPCPPKKKPPNCPPSPRTPPSPPCPPKKPPCPPKKPLSCPHSPPCPPKSPPSCPPSPPPCCRKPPPCPPSPPNCPPKKPPCPPASPPSCPPSPPPCCRKPPPCPPNKPTFPPKKPQNCSHCPPCPPESLPNCPPSPPTCMKPARCPSHPSCPYIHIVECPPKPALPPICPHTQPCCCPPLPPPPCPPKPTLCPNSPRCPLTATPCPPPSHPCTPPPCIKSKKKCPKAPPSCPTSPPSCCYNPNRYPAVPCKKSSSGVKKLFKRMPVCPASPPCRPVPCKQSFCKSLACQHSMTSVSYKALHPDAPYYYSPIHPCPPEPELKKPKFNKCSTSPCNTNDDFPWPTKNQMSNQSSRTSLFQNYQNDENGQCKRDCPMMPRMSCETVPSLKALKRIDCKTSCPNYPGSPRLPCLKKISGMQCPPPPRRPSPPAEPIKVPTQASSRSKSKMSGLYLKMMPSNKKSTCSKDCLAWESGKQNDGCISINSKEKITIRLKKDTPSTEEIREGLNIKVQDEDGLTLFERKDYRLQHTGCSMERRPSLLGAMYKASEVRRVITNDSVQAIGTDKDKRREIKEVASDPSIANLIEIQFKLKVTQGEKTTEIDIANDCEKENGENVEYKEPKNKSTQEVFVVKNEEERPVEHSDQKNDINIRIVIKNFKSKSGKKKSVNLKNEEYNDFSKKISAKFHTVSTGYSDIIHDDKVFSVHRATVDLTSSVDNTKTDHTSIHSNRSMHSNKSMVTKKNVNSNRNEAITNGPVNEIGILVGSSEVSVCRCITTEEDKSEDNEPKSYPSQKYSNTKEIHETAEETDTQLTDHKYEYNEDTDTDKPMKYDTEETDTDRQVEPPKYDTETDTEKQPKKKYDPFMSTTDTDEPDTLPEIKKSLSLDVIVKPQNKDEKKEMLKHVMEKVHDNKYKNKTRMRKLRDMLKVILTSDSSDHDDNKVPPSDLVKDVTYASLKPNYFRDTDSMNNYYKVDSKTVLTEATINRQVVYPTVENNSDCSNSVRSDVLSSENESKRGGGAGCMCSTVAARLKLASRLGCEGGGCCCAAKPVFKKNEETTCDLKKESDYTHIDYKTTEFVDVQTQNSRYLTSKINSTNLSVGSFNIKERIIADSGVLNVDSKEMSLRKTISPETCHIKECEMRKRNRGAILRISDEEKVVLLSGPSTRKDEMNDKTGMHAADILQSYEAKKAVLEIYTEKTISDDGEHLVAKLPKFVYDREQEIQANYEAMATNTYKTVCKKNVIMMAIKR